MDTQLLEAELRHQTAIEEAVDHLLALHPSHAGAEHRSSPRVSYSRPVQVTKDNKTDLCATKDISRTGIGFLHTRPLYGRVILGFTTPTGDTVRFLGEVVRARQVGRLFEIGAKFVERII